MRRTAGLVSLIALLGATANAQDPLGTARAIMTDNTIAFDGGPDDDTSYAFQIQPVYAIEVECLYHAKIDFVAETS